MNLEKLSRLYADAKILLPLVAIAFVILSLPSFIRDEQNLLIGREAYSHLRIAESPLSSYDELSYGGRFLLFNAYPLILNITSRAFNTDLLSVSIFLPIFFGLVAVMLFYFILKRLELSRLTTVLAAIALLISPAFIYLFSTSNIYIIPIILSLACFLLLLHDKKLLAYGLLLITIFFGLMPFLISMALLIIYSVKTKEYKGLYALFFLLLLLMPIIKFGMPEFLGFSSLPEGINFKVQSFIAEFGSEIGLSIFAVILAIFGFLHLWQKKYEHLAVYITIIALLLFSLLEIKSILYLNFFIAVLASLGIARLLYKRWESLLLNVVIGIILTVGLISAFVFQASLLANALPNKDVIDSFEYLSKETKENTVVFSYYTKGYWITALANRKNVMDENFLYAPDVNEKYRDSATLFYSREMNTTLSIIEKYNIKYIWIDAMMKNGQVWKEEDEGLLFLLGASKKFRKEYSNDYVEIWRVIT